MHGTHHMPVNDLFMMVVCQTGESSEHRLFCGKIRSWEKFLEHSLGSWFFLNKNLQ